MTLFYISGHRKFKTKSRKVMKYEKTLVNFKPFFEFFDIWVPITFRDKELMVWNFEFPSFLLCPTIPFLPFWAFRKTGQIISIWTQFQQMLKIIEIAHIFYNFTQTTAAKQIWTSANDSSPIPIESLVTRNGLELSWSKSEGFIGLTLCLFADGCSTANVQLVAP